MVEASWADVGSAKSIILFPSASKSPEIAILVSSNVPVVSLDISICAYPLWTKPSLTVTLVNVPDTPPPPLWSTHDNYAGVYPLVDKTCPLVPYPVGKMNYVSPLPDYIYVSSPSSFLIVIGP